MKRYADRPSLRTGKVPTPFERVCMYRMAPTWMAQYSDGAIVIDVDVMHSEATDGGWHHYCLTYAQATTKWVLYLDGVFKTSGQAALDTGGSDSRPHEPLTLGRGIPQASAEFFSGKIDEVSVYSSALDATSIAALYDAVVPVLIASYSFDDGSAANDAGSGLDGTITGALPTTGADGTANSALAFDGTNMDTVIMPPGVTDNILDDADRTICLWAVVDAFDNGGLFLYGTAMTAGVAAGTQFGLRTWPSGPNTFRVQFWTDDADVVLADAGDGGWHHYCLTYTQATLTWELYFDGVSKASNQSLRRLCRWPFGTLQDKAG